MNVLNNFISNALVFIIGLYRLFVSPLFPDACRHYPSCSSYCQEALKRYGVFRGGLLSIKRILKCNPFYPGGYDPLK